MVSMPYCYSEETILLLRFWVTFKASSKLQANDKHTHTGTLAGSSVFGNVITRCSGNMTSECISSYSSYNSSSNILP